MPIKFPVFVGVIRNNRYVAVAWFAQRLNVHPAAKLYRLLILNAVDCLQVCFNNIKINQHRVYQLRHYDVNSPGAENKLP